MRTMESKKNKQLVDTLLSGAADEQFQGKQVVVIGGKTFILPENDTESARLVETLEKQYPGETPHLVFVPRPETYILIFTV